MTTTICRDFRDLVAECAWRGLQAWELEEMIASPESLVETARLGDEKTFLSIAGLDDIEDRLALFSGLLAWLGTEEGQECLLREGQRWQVKGFATLAAGSLADMMQSLQDSWTPAKAGMLARALPAIAASRFNTLAERLGGVLKTIPEPGSLIMAYADAFSRNDRNILQAVDAAIIDDPVLGKLAIEMGARLLKCVGAVDFIDPASREKVVNCLALLIDDLVKKAVKGRLEYPTLNTQGSGDYGPSGNTGAPPSASAAH